MAVFLALRKLRPPRGSHIRLVLDNQTAVLCIKRGGSRSPSLNSVVLSLEKLRQKHGWFLTAVHLAGVRNVLADSLSRDSAQETEWTLDHKSFLEVQAALPNLQVDLFASHVNHKLQSFVTPYHHKEAVATDAMSLDWNRWDRIYLFPPVNILLKVLDKLRDFRGRAMLIAPLWPNSPWFPLLLELNPTRISFSNPQLSQIVSGRTLYDSSALTKHLHMWRF